MQALHRDTNKALNDTQDGISLFITEVTQIPEAVLQNRMRLDFLTAAQGRTCAVVKTECCVYIPDDHKNTSGFLTDI